MSVVRTFVDYKGDLVRAICRDGSLAADASAIEALELAGYTVLGGPGQRFRYRAPGTKTYFYAHPATVIVIDAAGRAVDIHTGDYFHKWHKPAPPGQS